MFYDDSMRKGYLQWKPGDETEVKEPCRGLYSGVKVVRAAPWVGRENQDRAPLTEDEAPKPQTITLSSATGVLGANESSVFGIQCFQDGSWINLSLSLWSCCSLPPFVFRVKISRMFQILQKLGWGKLLIHRSRCLSLVKDIERSL